MDVIAHRLQSGGQCLSVEANLGKPGEEPVGSALPGPGSAVDAGVVARRLGVSPHQAQTHRAVSSTKVSLGKPPARAWPSCAASTSPPVPICAALQPSDRITLDSVVSPADSG